MSTRVLRWGVSAYERATDLEAEKAGAEALGCSWSVATDRRLVPDLDGVGALVVTSNVTVDGPLLAAFGGSLVLTTTSGHDHIDVCEAARLGIAVGRCPLARRDPVVDWTLGSAIHLMRDQPALQQEAVDGRWARSALPKLASVALADATVAVVGLGVIGRRMAEVLGVLGAEVLGVDPAVRQAVALEEALRRADLVCVHCSLTESSRGLLNAERLGALRRGAVVVNAARGAVVDVPAAVALVVEGELRGVALDVFPQEPPPDLARLASVPGVLIAPHAAGFSVGLGRRITEGVLAGLSDWRSGRPQRFAVVPQSGAS